MSSVPLQPVLVTGATGGLGRRVALELAQRGAAVVVHGRRAEAAATVCAEIEQLGGQAEPLLADLGDLRELGAVLDGWGNRSLGGIIANAGLTLDRSTERSAQGYEATFAVNVLAHQMVLQRLSPLVVDEGRIVVVSSGVHDPGNRLARLAGVPAPDWQGVAVAVDPSASQNPGAFANGRLCYANSKLANIFQARVLQQRLRADGRRVDVFAIDPGLMVDTDFVRDAPRVARWLFRAIGRVATPMVANMRLSTTSAKHLASLVADEQWTDAGFEYLDGDHVRPPSADAADDDLALAFWSDASDLVAGG